MNRLKRQLIIIQELLGAVKFATLPSKSGERFSFMKISQIKEYFLSSLTLKENRQRARKLQAIALISALVMFLLNGIRIYDYIINPYNSGLPITATFGLFIFFLIVWWLSKVGRTSFSASLLLGAYSVPTIFCYYQWGADLPAAILMTVLIVVMAGMFLGTKLALITAGLFSGLMLILSYLQIKMILPTNSSWRLQPHQMADAISYVLIFSLIFLLAWIIIRENIQALAAEELAKQELKAERDQLEATVNERTKVIREMQREKLEQLQTLASIGQLSGGIFHDIANPLTVVGLNLELIKNEGIAEPNKHQNSIQRAIIATKRIGDLIASANHCLRQQNNQKNFSVLKEIEQIIMILETKARSQRVVIFLNTQEDVFIRGSKTRFNQVIMNLISNAIEACQESNQLPKKVIVTINKPTDNNLLSISINDNGIGISEQNINAIFNPFFSTKSSTEKNLGLGLSIVKEIIEHDFNGQIKVTSTLLAGSNFDIYIPIKL